VRYLPYLGRYWGRRRALVCCRDLLRNNNSFAALFEYEACFDTCSMSMVLSVSKQVGKCTLYLNSLSLWGAFLRCILSGFPPLFSTLPVRSHSVTTSDLDTSVDQHLITSRPHNSRPHHLTTLQLHLSRPQDPKNSKPEVLKSSRPQQPTTSTLTTSTLATSTLTTSTLTTPLPQPSRTKPLKKQHTS